MRACRKAYLLVGIAAGFLMQKLGVDQRGPSAARQLVFAQADDPPEEQRPEHWRPITDAVCNTVLSLAASRSTWAARTAWTVAGMVHLVESPGEFVVAAPTPEGAVFDQPLDDLLDEERVPARAGLDEFRRPVHRGVRAEQTRRGAPWWPCPPEGLERYLGVMRTVSPGRPVLRTERHNEEDAGGWEAPLTRLSRKVALPGSSQCRSSSR